MTASSLHDLISALQSVDDVSPSVTPPGKGTVFVGSGDSLSSGLLGDLYGHRAMSSGDITWMGQTPPATETVVGISHSGTSGATVRALRIARNEGKRTIAITSNATSPLANEADELQLVPTLALTETIPCAGHLMLGLGVSAVSGEETEGLTDQLAHTLTAYSAAIADAVDQLPAEPPHGISILSLPELRAASDFWMLKLIEATGISVRTVALEESGHVDYFIGPEPHLSIQLIGAHGHGRFRRLAEALDHTGQIVQPVHLPAAPELTTAQAIITELAGAVVGTQVAAAAAASWARPPFRGGAVNMDARHIKLDEEPAIAQ
jgi:hypothetical protein